ncbi:MAG: universal stress protein [Chloroflexi bacterium]|nr:universal stress protein [Chloroflexota bacterium]MBI3339759.1 universal stress protein [Chloroflexota bacterium]
MFKNILVPLDGSKLSEASLGPASLLAQKLKAHITLLHVIEQDAPSEVHKERHLTRPDEAEAYLKDAAQRAFPSDIKVETHVHTAPVSDVAKSIIDHITEFKPDLIVICAHGHSGIRDVLIGSIAQQIVAHGAAPLLLVKPDSPRFQLDRILIPLDPDSQHDNSLPVAKSFGTTFGAKLHLLSVIPTFSTLAGEQAAAGNLLPVTVQALLDIKEENASEDLNIHTAEFRKEGIKVFAEVARGDPARGIVKIAELSGADLIILTTHRKAGIGAFWARSVAPKVAQKTKMPLLLIPLSTRKE